MEQMPVFIARKLNLAFSKDRGLWKNVENINSIFTSEYFKMNLASHPRHIIIEECNFSKCYHAFIGTSKVQIW